MNTFYIILAIAGAFILGYQFCLLRWRPKDLCETARVMTELHTKEITIEEASERMDKIRL